MKNNLVSLVTLTTLFFMWGFLTCMNDILIPYMKGVFELKYWQAMLVQFAFFGAYFIGSLLYFVFSVRYGDPINKIGYKNGIIIGLIVSGIGCLLFYPAAQFELYIFFLGALFILGLGFTLLQIAANPFVIIIGPEATASSRLNLSQAFNSFGTTIAPIIGGYLIFEYFFSDTAAAGEAVKVPYVIFGAVFLLLALVVSFVPLPSFQNTEEIQDKAGALKYPHLILGVLAIFTYVGGEVAIGSFIINFMGLDQIAGLEEVEAKDYLAFYWGGAMIGRFCGAVSLSKIGSIKKFGYMIVLAALSFLLIFTLSGTTIQDVWPYVVFIVLNLLAFLVGQGIAGRTLGIFSIVNIALLMVAIFGQGYIAVWCLLSIGLFNSIMWPNIFSLAVYGLKEHTAQGSSLLVMAILGGALVPVIQGFLADLIGVQLSFCIPVVCYIYLLYYGFIGSKPRLSS